MKIIQMIFPTSAVMLAAASIYASTTTTFLYYVPIAAKRTVLSCDMQITNPCSDTGSLNCLVDVSYFDPDDILSFRATVLVGKKEVGPDSYPTGPCLQVFRAY